MIDIVADIKKHKARRDRGEVNCIPFHDAFPKLAAVIPGIVKGVMYGISASSGIGKSKFTRHAFIKTPFDYVHNHPEAGIKLKILYFALEENAMDFAYNTISMRLAEKNRYYVGIDYLQSNMKLPIDDKMITLIEDDSEWREKFYDTVEVIDNITNPTGIWKHCEKRAKEFGRFVENKVQVTKFKEDGTRYVVTEIRGTKYIPNDPNLYVVVIVDHLNLLTKERAPGYESQTPRKLSKHETMERWVTDYARKVLCKEWGWSVVNVIQQTADGEKQQYSRAGDIIGDRTRPSLEKFGNNKEIARDHHIIVGVWDPFRYKIPTVGNWDIHKMQGYYRELSILKNRRNRGDVAIDLFFEGASGVYQELNGSNDKTRRDKIYAKVQKFEDRTIK